MTQITPAPAVDLSHLSEQQAKTLLQDAYAIIHQLAGEASQAFKGAFDTPLERRRRNDEYAEDSRNRMRYLKAESTSFLGKLSAS
ncbi:hypothetical protein ACYPKM_02290 [Pseudomonas aeruginosa]